MADPGAHARLPMHDLDEWRPDLDPGYGWENGPECRVCGDDGCQECRWGAAV